MPLQLCCSNFRPIFFIRLVAVALIQQMIRPLHLPSAKLLAFLLACSLLIAQWTGLQHRVVHAHLLAGSIHSISDSSDNEASDKHLVHSCLLLDATAIGASLPCSDYRPAWLNYTPPPTAVLPPVSWQALFTRQFSSRAPPFFKLS